MKNQIRNEIHELYATTLEEVVLQLPAEKVRLNEVNQLQGASVWFSTLPLKEKKLHLYQQEFKIRYGWPLLRLPLLCSCCLRHYLQHSLYCFVTICHDKIRNKTTQLLT